MLDDYLENLVANVACHTGYFFGMTRCLGDYAFYDEGFGQILRPALALG